MNWMIGEGYTISYLNYAVFLWILSGILILLIDVRGFQLAGMNKERKVSKFIGWLSIIIGLLVFFVNTVLQ
ncbi:CLC_0170 family protein [Paenibacillus sp. LPE1-1-1.1]|uniref:CLC_0170 family protein n=1 Tax=Paenibacillus sp. LPE1-1-1.1 TaxID=3135230 RepID=UPI00342E4789